MFCQFGQLEDGSGDMIQIDKDNVKSEGDRVSVHDECLVWSVRQFNPDSSEFSSINFDLLCDVCDNTGSVLKCRLCHKAAHIKCADDSSWYLNIADFEAKCDSCKS